MIRTFVALDLPEPVQQSLEAFAAPLRQGDYPVRWIPVERIHLTLKFLGNVPSERIGSMAQALSQAVSDLPPFALQPAGCGAFPSIKKMRVVWVGVRGDLEALKALQKKVEGALAPLGFPPEDRPFRAHLTIGRVKGSRNLKGLQQALLAGQSFEGVAFDVSQVVLYKSDLKPDGARYTPLHRIPLGSTGTTI
ncbi:2'-5' RNA ligase [Desulfacinum hydrothermale DSM 13146]|uniref:RNA 2',3'-cyclic phosphodiesterase n=1 Tax=Desulfacinum hydrothermale DSM 13146 TaxID=1121390 RepID=A0A1W1XCG1_9BACT|nr:RNA 2',3'-cyclic phosphodiesterase [Desulfacinum hydrothermale]SMC21577.1 2'-5' RNA ligase [Desulfacinum hydrothermale DSM 13146]